ncbi:hypothetical protein Gotri_015264 [Gossypium trilobum]|uniref:Uncharacterized protein n=1 Tax=Gossypium trilobum TaxID=34281 RepID=A0A7J9DZI6_9ROSI|nr:hypothetical protein [Gossypium trilobum]
MSSGRKKNKELASDNFPEKNGAGVRESLIPVKHRLPSNIHRKTIWKSLSREICGENRESSQGSN